MKGEYIGGSSVAEKQVWADVNGWMYTQAVQWEPAGRSLLKDLGDGTGLRAVDMGCGPLGWLRLLSEWVGSSGQVIGTEISEETAEPARQVTFGEGLSNVEIVADNIFNSRLPEHSFDLLHARMVLGPLGNPEAQLATYHRLLKPGGWLVLEEPSMKSWSYNPAAPANQRLCDLMIESYKTLGRDVNIGLKLRELLRRYGDQPGIRAHILALPPGHAYRAFPLMGATAIKDQIAANLGLEAAEALFAQAHEELLDPEMWCTTFALIQGYIRMPD